MNHIALTTVTVLTAGIALAAHAKSDPSLDGAPRTIQSEARASDNTAASLRALLVEWDQAGFNAPGKPGQPRVYGRGGYVTTGGGYGTIASLIRSAVSDVSAGRDVDAAPKIARARNLLAAGNLANARAIDDLHGAQATALIDARAGDLATGSTR